METFVMCGKYSPDAMQGMSANRTNEALALIRKHKGEVVSMYALLGEHDLMCVIKFPGMREAMKAAVELCKWTGIAFTTSPAVTVAEFDELMSKG